MRSLGIADEPRGRMAPVLGARGWGGKRNVAWWATGRPTCGGRCRKSCWLWPTCRAIPRTREEGHWISPSESCLFGEFVYIFYVLIADDRLLFWIIWLDKRMDFEFRVGNHLRSRLVFFFLYLSLSREGFLLQDSEEYMFTHFLGTSQLLWTKISMIHNLLYECVFWAQRSWLTYNGWQSVCRFFYLAPSSIALDRATPSTTGCVDPRGHEQAYPPQSRRRIPPQANFWTQCSAWIFFCLQPVQWFPARNHLYLVPTLKHML